MFNPSNEAGPSRLPALISPSSTSDSHNHLTHTGMFDHDRIDIKHYIEDTHAPEHKRSRTQRPGKACLSCRVKKRKCGGQPPQPCPNCIKAEEDCSWAVQDGRSSAVRREKARARMADGQGIQSFDSNGNNLGLSGDGLKHRPISHDTIPESGIDDSWASLDETNWLNALMAGIAQESPNELSNNRSNNPSLSTSISYDASLYPLPLTQHPPISSSSLYETARPSGEQAGMPPSAGLSSTHPFQLFSHDHPIDVPDWPSDVDPFDLIMAMSSRMPMVEQSTVPDGTSPASDSILSNPTGTTPLPPVDGNRNSLDMAELIGHVRQSDMRTKGPRGTKPREKFVKVTWWRPHGLTAIAPGLKRTTLRVRISDDLADKQGRSPGAWSLPSPGQAGNVFESPRTPSVSIMRHLMDVFKEHFGSQFPFLDLDKYMNDLEESNGSIFLLNCIAATAARFSSHPAIALPHLKPHEYGNVFYDVAKDMLGSMLAVPLRETVAALVLLCHVGFANDSEAEEWMFAGMAVRLAVDLGLHLGAGEEQGISEEDRRLNRLLFWSVVIQDFALSFGTGRQTTFRMSEITQQLPTETDLSRTANEGSDRPGHPFIWAAKQMFSYGRLIELLNSHEPDVDGRKAREIQRCKIKAIKEYAQLPHDMSWNVANLQRHAAAGTAPAYLQIHLWMHTIIASGHLTGTDYLRRAYNGNAPRPDHSTKSGAVTPNGMAASDAWRHSARTIGDILVLSDVICPKAYAALPFCNQAFYVAGSCYVKELEQESQARQQAIRRIQEPAASTRKRQRQNSHSPEAESHSETDESEDPGNVTDLFKSILASVSTENIAGLRKGLAKQTIYWSGVAWVAEALEQRIQGIGASEIDLVRVAEKIASVASIPDAGALHRSTPSGGAAGP